MEKPFSGIPRLLTQEDLARLLRVSVKTIQNRQYLHPETLPPSLYLPGCRGPRYLQADVLAWLENARVVPAKPEPVQKKVGRPRIVDQRRRRVRR